MITFNRDPPKKLIGKFGNDQLVIRRQRQRLLGSKSQLPSAAQYGKNFLPLRFVDLVGADADQVLGDGDFPERHSVAPKT